MTNLPNGDELRSEYDFRDAQRGRQYKPLHEGYTVEIHQSNGTTRIQKVQAGNTPINVEEVVNEAMEIGRHLAALPVLDGRSLEEMLYDEDGLPA